MTKVKALRNLYKKMTGNEGTFDTVAEGILAVSGAFSAAALPTVTGSDNGKVLVVAEGSWGKGAAPAELPTVTGSDNGKVLIVAEGAWGKGAVPTELPAVSADDDGKVLGVVDGAWAVMSLPE